MDSARRTARPHAQTDWDEITRRGQEYYDRHLRARLEPHHRDEFVAIDVDSGDYFLGATVDAALDAALQQRPQGKFHIVRVGHLAALRLLQCR